MENHQSVIVNDVTNIISETSASSQSAINGKAEELDHYIPHDNEPFMNERQMQFFKEKLLGWKADILSDSKETLNHLQLDSSSLPDSIDRASAETDKGLELRTRDRQRKLIAKIDDALRRIQEGNYGYCEETGEPISLGRLIARPIATLTLEAQERHEKQERIHRDD